MNITSNEVAGPNAETKRSRKQEKLHEVSSHVNKYCQKKLANVGNGANNPIANKKVGKPSYENNPVGALLELFQWKGQMPRTAILPE